MLPAPTPPSYSSGHTALPDSVHTPSVTAAPVPRGLDAHDDTPTAPSSFAPTLYHYDGTTDHYATPHHHHPSSYLYSPSVPAPPALWPPHTQPHPVLDPHYPYTQDQHVHQSFNHPTSDPQIYYSYFPSLPSQFIDVATQYGTDSSSLASYALPAAATLPTSYTAPNLAFVPGVPKLEDFSAQSPLAASTSLPQWPFTWTPPHAAPLPFHRPVLISPGSASGLDRALDEQRITLRVVPAPRDPSPAPSLASDAASGSPANTPQPSVLSPPSSSSLSSSPTQVVALVLCSPPPMAHLPLPNEDIHEDFASPAPDVPSEYQFVADPAAFPGPDQPAPVPRKRSIQVSTAVPHEPSASSASTSTSSSPPMGSSTPSASSASSPGSSSPSLATPSSAEPLAQTLPLPPSSRARTGSSSRKVSQPPGTTRKKPALACLFCRERKIACGPPPQGSEDMTCSQCKRRHRKCEFPKENRRVRS